VPGKPRVVTHSSTPPLCGRLGVGRAITGDRDRAAVAHDIDVAAEQVGQRRAGSAATRREHAVERSCQGRRLSQLGLPAHRPRSAARCRRAEGPDPGSPAGKPRLAPPRRRARRGTRRRPRSQPTADDRAQQGTLMTSAAARPGNPTAASASTAVLSELIRHSQGAIS
jgi:hypothetical protein